MKRFLIGVFALLLTATSSHATYIYESATGPFEQSIGGVTVSDTQFAGAQFTLTQTTSVSAIGGRFYGWLQGNIFGALLDLNGTSLPSNESELLSSVIAHALFDPQPNMDSEVGLMTTLNPGTYGVLFGSGLFGATGSEAIQTLPFADLTFNAGQDLYAQSSRHLYSVTRPDFRVFVKGSPAPVPEPGTLALSLIGLIGLVGVRKFHRSN